MNKHFESLTWINRDQFDPERNRIEGLFEEYLDNRYAVLEPEIYLIGTDINYKFSNGELHPLPDRELFRIEAYKQTKSGNLAFMGGVNHICLDSGYVGGVFVEEPFRRQGLATRMLKHAIKLVSPSSIYVYGDNHPAIECYRKLGFQLPENYKFAHDIICMLYQP